MSQLHQISRLEELVAHCHARIASLEAQQQVMTGVPVVDERVPQGLQEQDIVWGPAVAKFL